MGWFSKFFGNSLSPEKMLRKNQRALNTAIRNMDRERSRIEQQEKKIIFDIKKMAKDGHIDAVRIMAQDLVRTRRYIKKFMLMKANLQAVSMRIVSLRSQVAVSSAMTDVTLAMRAMNREMNIPQIKKILQEFEKQSFNLEIKDDIVNGAMDDALGEEDDEENSDSIVTQVLDELGLQLADKLCDLPEPKEKLKNVPAKYVPAPMVDNANCGLPKVNNFSTDADIQYRLDNLRREDFPEIPKTNPD